MKRLSTSQLVTIHDRIVAQTGGSTGIRDSGRIEAALARPFTEFGDQELFPLMEEKAAALMHGLAKGHPFVDGNKRTATVVSVVFLRVNGYRLMVSQEEFEETAVAVAEGRMEIPALARWFKANMVEHSEEH